MNQDRVNRPVGDVFSVTIPENGDIKLTVVRTLKPSCKGCYFYNKLEDKITCIIGDYPLGPCSSEYREDETNVVFMSDEERSRQKKMIDNFGKGNIKMSETTIEEGSGLKKFMLGAMLATAPLMADAEVSKKLTPKVLDAIAQVESGGKNGIKVKDTNGLISYGMYQIQEPYLKDANQYMGTNYTVTDVQHKPEIARKVIKGYIERYTKSFIRRNDRSPTIEEMISMHNGGPTGYKKEAAKKYANKVLKRVNESV